MAKPWRVLGAMAGAACMGLAIVAEFRVWNYGLTMSDSSRGIWWWFDKQIESGQEPADQGMFIDVFAPSTSWVIRSVFILELLGYVYSHSVKGSLFELLTASNDFEARFCRQLLDYRWLHPMAGGGMHFPQVRASGADMELWVQYCQQEWKNLSPQEQKLLQWYRAAGGVPEHIMTQPFPDVEKAKAESRREPIEEYRVGKRLSRKDLEGLVNTSIRASNWNALTDGADFKPHSALTEGDVQMARERMLDYYESLDTRDLPMLPSDWKAIGRTIREGGMAAFDARPLLPAELWNISFKGLADMEGPGASRISVLSNGCHPRSMKNFADMHELDKGARMPFNLADSAAITFLDKDIDEAKMKAMATSGFVSNVPGCKVGYVNNRRMKNFYSKLPDIPKEMGMEDEILREEGYLWMGPVRGGFHYDEEANIYIQLSGESDVFLIPQSHVDMFSPGIRFKNMPTRAEIAMDPWMKRVPFHLLRLRPGDGIVFPGRAFHLFLAQTYDRLAVNFFFMPKWRKMEYTEYDWYSQIAAEPSGLERLAVRQLWARTLVRLYEETGRGVIYMGEKNEYI